MNPHPDTSGLRNRKGLGRPKGAQNKATREFKEWAQKFYKSPAYRRSVEQRILRGKSPQMETYLAQLLYGKPKEQVEHSGDLNTVPAIVNVFTDSDVSTD